jgi:chorismate mutase
MQNQQNKTPELQKTLNLFRQDIDQIDHQIIALLEERMEIISQVGELKKSNKEKFFIRSSREADMIKSLLNKSSSKFPKSTIANIWRKIITAANMHEQPFSIALHNPKNISDYAYLVREYYNDEISIISCDSANNVVSEIEKDIAQIGVFALPKNDSDEGGEHWWVNLANNQKGIKIFAKIPFVKFLDDEKNHHDTELVAVGIKTPEKSNQDNTLLCVELKSEISKQNLLMTLKDCGAEAKILKTAQLTGVKGIKFYLVEIAGFFVEGDAVVEFIKNSDIKPYVKALGHYATPILV